MTKTLDNFIKNIKKLDNYSLLREEEDYLLIGTCTTVKINKPLTGNIFQPQFVNIVNKDIYICFIISLIHDKSKLKRFQEMPILYIPTSAKSYNPKKLQEFLDSFISMTFDN